MIEFFKDENNRLSMKRLVGFISTLSLCVTMILKPLEYTVYSVCFIASSSLGFTTMEKIFKKKEDGSKET
jgi:hypothetical protein